MKYQPKHMREEHGAKTDSKHTDSHTEKHTLPVGRTPDSDQEQTGTPAGAPDNTRVHPLGIPIPDPGDGGEYVPIPGKGSIEHIAPNGAVIRNPWSEQPEIKPDHAYTDEQQDQNLLIM